MKPLQEIVVPTLPPGAVIQEIEIRVDAPTDQYDRYQLQTLIEGGWTNFDRKNYEGYQQARKYFEFAIRRCHKLQIDDHRLAASQTGHAWCCYQLDAILLPEGKLPGDADRSSCYQGLLTKLAAPLAWYHQRSLTGIDRVYQARAFYLAGILNVYLCNGPVAEERLTTAAEYFADTDQNAERAEVVYLQGAIACCKGQTAEANKRFLEAYQVSPLNIVKAHALIDYVSSLIAMCRFREARRMVTTWRLEFDQQLPAKARYWADLVFCRANVKFGDLQQAAEFHESANQVRRQLLQDKDLTPIEHNVFRVVASEFWAAKGKFDRAAECASSIDIDFELTRYGYRLMRLLAIDSGCKLCLVESICHCYQQCCSVCCGCCCTCTVETICFEEQKKVRAEFDVNGFFDTEKIRLHGEIFLAQDQLASAKAHFQEASPRLATYLSQSSPARLSVVADLIETNNRRHDSREFYPLLTDAIQVANANSMTPISNAMLSRQHPLWSRMFGFSGFWRNRLALFDLAEDDLQRGIEVGESTRHVNHRKNIELRIELIDAYVAQQKFESANSMIELAQQQFSESGICDCALALKIKERCAMVNMLSGCQGVARSKLQRIGEEWDALIRERFPEESFQPLETKVWLEKDSGRFNALLWHAISGVGMDGVNSDFEFNQVVSLAKAIEIEDAAVARMLNVHGIVLKNANRWEPAQFLYEKAIALYQHIGMGSHAEQVRQNLLALDEAFSNSQSSLDCD